MTSLRSWFVSLAVLVALLASVPARAQSSAQTPSAGSSSRTDGRISLHVNFGAQAGSGDLSQRLSPSIYDETATIDITQNYESGPLFDVGGSYTIFGNFGVGVSYSHTSGDGNASVAAQIPDPLVFDRPRGASATASGLKHSESAVHLSALYRFAASPKLDVTVGIGPTFFSVKQELLQTVDVAEGSPGPVITPRVAEATDSAVGAHVSADATYMITDMIGAGVLLRFAKSTAEVSATDAQQSVDVRAGGFQIAAGVRVRF